MSVVLRQTRSRSQIRSYFATVLMFTRHPGLTPSDSGRRLTSTELGPGGKPRSGLRFGGLSTRGTDFNSEVIDARALLRLKLSTM